MKLVVIVEFQEEVDGFADGRNVSVQLDKEMLDDCDDKQELFTRMYKELSDDVVRQALELIKQNDKSND